MWQDLKIIGVEKIEKCIAEFVIWMHGILPYGKMKVKIYEDGNGIMTGITDVRIKRKFDGNPESAVGYGKTIEEVLEEVIINFNSIVEEDYPNKQYPDGLTENEIEYSDFSDF